MTTMRADPLARQLKRTWQQLPSGHLTERQMDEAIIRARDLYEGDYAGAGAIRASLVNAGAVTVRQGDERGEWVYEKADAFPELPFNGYGSEPFNRELARLSEQEQARLAALDEQRRLEFERSPWGWQRKQIIALIDQRIDERLGEVLREASLDEQTIARVRGRLAVIDSDDAA